MGLLGIFKKKATEAPPPPAPEEDASAMVPVPEGNYWIDLPFDAHTIEAVQDSSLWIRPKMGREFTRLDVRTGQELAKVELPEPITKCGTHSEVLGDRIAVAGTGFDAETGKQVWAHEGCIAVGHIDDWFLFSKKTDAGDQLLICRPKDGKVLRRIDAPTGFSWTTPQFFNLRNPQFVVAEDKLVVVNDRELVCVGLTDGKVLWRTPTGRFPSPPIKLGAAILLPQHENTDKGRVTDWSSVDLADGTLTVLLQTPGWSYRPPLLGEFLTLHTIDEQHRLSVVAVTRDNERSPEIYANECVYAASPRRSVIGQPGVANIFVGSEARVSLIRVPLPSGDVKDAAITDEAICILQPDRLFVLPFSYLPVNSDTDLSEVDAEFSPLFAGRNQKIWEEPASVIFAGQSLAMLEHPQLGRMKLDLVETDPAVAAGDKVYLDDASQDAPGVVTVRAWHVEGGTAVSVIQDAIYVPESDLPPRLREQSQEPQFKAQEALAALEELLGREVEPMLATFARVFDADPAFQDWVDQCEFRFSPKNKSEAWEGSDPCLLSLAWQGGGIIYSFYFYPPAFEADGRLPVVLWEHETNELEWLAPDFEAFITGFLAEWRDEDPELVNLIASKIGVEVAKDGRYRSGAPEWFVQVQSDRGMDLDAAETLLKSDPLKAERALVRLFWRDYENEPRLFDLLEEAYATLGWKVQRDNLDSIRES